MQPHSASRHHAFCEQLKGNTVAGVCLRPIETVICWHRGFSQCAPSTALAHTIPKRLYHTKAV